MKFFAPAGLQDVYRSLALENLLLEAPAAEEGLLFCWRGEPAVVMGKNQNPWRECNLDFIRERGCKLARRISGGGTVYHDPGNLNISWILPRGDYSADKMHGILIRSLSAVGIDAAVGKGGALTVKGKKISGSAFCYRKDRVLHHGTLLVDADLDTLRAALSPSRFQLQTHAVASLPAAVMNLKDLRPEVDRKQIQESLLAEAGKVFGSLSPLQRMPEVEMEALRLAADEWIWAQTPGFHTRLMLPEGCGLTLQVRKGKVSECRIGEVQVDLREPPDFPYGDFGELERKLGMAAGGIRGLVAEAGWVKI